MLFILLLIGHLSGFKVFERMKTTYFGLFPTYLLLILFKITTLLLLSGNIGKVAELWTLAYLARGICLSTPTHVHVID